MLTSRKNNQSSKRRGAVFVMVLVSLVVMLGFASLTLDVGALYNTRADLQNAADAAALSGASVLTENAMIQIRASKQQTASQVTQAVYERSVAVAAKLTSFGGSNIILQSGDVVTGWTDLTSGSGSIDEGKPASQFNTVQVTIRRSKTSANGPVDLFFASIFGKSSADVSASATAAFDDRVAGYDADPGEPDILPFTVHIDTYDKLLAQLSDQYEYDEVSDNVSSGTDGVPEVNIHPEKLAPGNFGRLAIGAANVQDQIKNGVSSDDLELEIGVPYLSFYDADGEPLARSMSGDSGMKSELEGVIHSRVGDVVAIPVHSSVSGSGSNAVYTIVGVRFVRVMHVKLNGPTKGLWLQPVTYMGPGLILHVEAASSRGTGGQIILVR